jgi:hypothetical protein
MHEPGDGQTRLRLTELPLPRLPCDWVEGGLFHATAEGKATRLLPLAPGSADLGSVPGQGLVLVPMSADGTLLAYRVD